MSKFNNRGETLTVLMIAIGLLAAFSLYGLKSFNFMLGGMKDVSYKRDTYVLLQKWQSSLSTFGGACQASFGPGHNQFILSTGSSPAPTISLTDLQFPGNGGSIVSAGQDVGGGLKVTSIQLKNLQTANGNSPGYVGDLQFQFQAPAKEGVTPAPFTQGFPLFMKTAVSASSVTIQDCSSRPPLNQAMSLALCSSMRGPAAQGSTSGQWLSNWNSCMSPTPLTEKAYVFGPWYVMAGDSVSIKASDVLNTTPGMVFGGPSLVFGSVGLPKNGRGTVSGEGTSSLTYSSTSGQNGADAIDVTLKNSAGGTMSGRVLVLVMTPFTWTGIKSAAWGDLGNWCGTVNPDHLACSGVSALPSTSDTIVFDDTCLFGNRCIPTTDGDINVQGVVIAANGFKQGIGKAITVGSSGLVQSGGLFQGSDSPIVATGAVSLTGGKFVATSNVTTIYSKWDISPSAPAALAFDAQGGKLTFAQADGRLVTVIPGNVDYANVNFAGYWPTIELSGGAMKVRGKLSFAFDVGGHVNSGTLLAYGDVTVSGIAAGSALVKVSGNSAGQTISTPAGSISNLEIAAGTNAVTLSGNIGISGDFSPVGSYTFTSAGTFNTSGSTLSFGASDGKLVQINPGNVDYGNVSFGGYWPTVELSGGTMKVRGTLNFTFNSGGHVNSGTMLAYGDVTASGDGVGGNGLVKVAGNPAGQTISAPGGGAFANLEIAAGTNPVTFSGTIGIVAPYGHPTGSYTFTSAGTFNTAGSTLSFGANDGKLVQINPGNVDYGNVSFAGYGPRFDLSGGTMKVRGSLTFSFGAYGPGFLNSGTLLAYGNAQVTGEVVQGNVSLRFSGSSPLTLSESAVGGPYVAAGALSLGTVVDLSSGATLSLSQNASIGNLSIANGGVNLGGRGLSVTSLSLGGNTLTKAGGILTVNGVVAGTGSLFGGTVSP